MSLTDLWEEGKLEEGWYYIECLNGEIHIDYFDNHLVDVEFSEYEGEWREYDETIKKVLAPVPSYEELQSMKEQLNKEGTWYTEISYKKLQKERDFLDTECKRLTQEDTDHIFDCIKLKNEVETLRDLLKECKICIELSTCKITPTENYAKKLLTSINTAIGDKLSPAESEE